MNLKMMSNLQQRLIVGSFSTFIMLLAIYLSYETYFRPFFVLIMAGVVGMALWEFYAIALNKGLHPLRHISIFCSTVYLIAIFLSTQSPAFALLPRLALLGSLILVFARFFMRGDSPFINIAITFFGMIYLTFPLAYIININYGFSDGRLWLIYLLIVTKMTDIGAYIAGKNFGKRKITPYISPSKTLEGAFGGFLGALLASSALWYGSKFITLTPALSLTQSLTLGFLFGIVAQFGDLTESLLKRDGNIKDSNSLPGLGGMLDIVDSMVFTAPLLYFFLKYQELMSF
jgi:phosphatidate cytidylyltransferase